jgi:uracil-DNA glycosylase
MTNRDLWYGSSGPPDAGIVIVGESWGLEELAESQPFVGQSGQEFNRMLSEAGLNRDEIFCTNVVNKKPPRNELGRLFLPYSKDAPKHRGLNPTAEIMAELSRLKDQLTRYPRDLIIVAGNWALWALTDKTGVGSKHYEWTVKEPTGIISWRASQIYSDTLPTPIPVLPIVHPAAILREWKWRQTTVQDLRRAHQISDWKPKHVDIYIPRSFEEIETWFEPILQRAEKEPIRLANDIETFKGLITVIGFGYGSYSEEGHAIAIPLVKTNGKEDISSWWDWNTEARIIALIRRVLSHPNILIEGQNYLYDTQYFIRWLGISPRCDFDTMLAQHLLFPGTPKGLDFLSSLYCHYHRYWKDDGKDWEISGNQTEHLIYNGEDCLRTAECATVLRRLISHFGMEELWENEKRKAALALRMMLKGIRIDMEHRSQLRRDIFQEQMRIQNRLSGLIPSSIIPVPKSSKVPWYASPHQQRTLFYEVLGLTGQVHRKTKKATINDEALNSLQEEYPELSTIWSHLAAERSVGVFRENFLDAEVDADGRMRSSFNIAGTETFRWSSSENVFGSGTNLQNIPKGDEE